MEKIPLKKKHSKEEIFLNALAEAYRLQESIINTTELSIISTTPEGLITSFNRAAEKLTGYTAEEMIGKASPIVLHDKIELIERAEALSSELGIEVEPTFDVFTAEGKNKQGLGPPRMDIYQKRRNTFPCPSFHYGTVG